MPFHIPRDSDPVPAALLAAAEAAFTALTTYTLTLHSHPENGEPVALRYSFRKPGFIRMDFIRPHAGATLIFDPRTRTARVWPFGFPRFPSLALDPGNPMIRGPQGHRVDQSDLGTLVRNLRALHEGGAASVANVGDPGVSSGRRCVGPDRGGRASLSGLVRRGGFATQSRDQRGQSRRADRIGDDGRSARRRGFTGRFFRRLV